MLHYFRKEKKLATPHPELTKILNKINNKVTHIYSVIELSGVEEYEQLKKLDFNEQKQIINNLTDLILHFSKAFLSKGIGNNKSLLLRKIAETIQGGLLKRKLNYTEEEWIELFQNYKNCSTQIKTHKNHSFGFNQFPINFAIRQIEYYLKNNDPSEKLIAFVNELINWPEFQTETQFQYYGSDLKKAVKKLNALLAKEGELPPFSLKTEDIGNEVNHIINSITNNKASFDQIFTLASSVSGGKPTNKFTTEASKLQDNIGLESYRKIVHQIISIPIQQGITEQTISYQYRHGDTRSYTEATFLCSPSQIFIKGIVWTMDRFSDKESIRLLSKLCEKSYTKIPQKGPAAAALGNACVYVLGNMRGKDGLGALSRLKLKVRQNNVKRAIDNHLISGAEKYNVSVEELKEMAVPDFNLTNGEQTISFDDYQLKISIEARKVSQQWTKPDGKAMKTVPSIVKNSTVLSKKLKEIRKKVKEIQKVYSAQKQRIDNQFILDRTWDFPSFQKYYLNHGLVAPIAKKLIWTFSKDDKFENAIFINGKWYSKEDQIIEWIDQTCSVKLWHPVNADEASIIAWRNKMMELEWKQPMKQAFREIYILTAAEVNTRSYSNRMASHILKQHQFSSLANLRGWKYALMGAYDDGRDNEICRKYLAEFNITAEFWIDELNQDESWNETGIWNYISTDQVKFKQGGEQAMDLVNVPKIVFTEIMRDVDMFVGVCSVGNDPQWMDNNGERQTNRDYWNLYSFGDLTEIAKTRKTILESLLPRLKKIRDKTSIDGKFLRVKGQIRDYKIHIGSGNILMEPNDQYLCIVAARSSENTTEKLFIPFEGDKGLSIVLSKAFLLAEDDKIVDPTITSQIKRK